VATGYNCVVRTEDGLVLRSWSVGFLPWGFGGAFAAAAFAESRSRPCGREAMCAVRACKHLREADKSDK
jgi:hypothetical protein